MNKINLNEACQAIDDHFKSLSIHQFEQNIIDCGIFSITKTTRLQRKKAIIQNK